MYISDFHIVDLRSGQFGDLPIVSDWAKNQVLKYLTHLFNSLRMMMNYLRMTSPVQSCISNHLIGQLRSNDDVIRSIHIYSYNF